MEVGGLRSADYSAKRGAEAEEDIRKGSYGETRGKAGIVLLFVCCEHARLFE